MISLSTESYRNSLSLCTIIDDPIPCKMTLSLIHQQLDDLTSQFTDIQNQHSDLTRFKRSPTYNSNLNFGHSLTKRGILDGVSYPINWLFGIPDADDAKFYRSSIEDLINDQKQTHVLMQSQIRVISDTIKNLNQTYIHLDKVEEKLNENFYKFNIFMNDSRSIINKNSAQLEIIDHLMLIKQLNDVIQRELDRYTSSISLARHGIIDYKILPPKTLLTELQNSVKFQLPLEPSWQNLEAYYKMITLKAFVSENKLVIIIKIPITSVDVFSLYKLYPFPTPHKINSEILSFVKPNFDYLVISKSRSQYTLLKNLDHCKEFTKDEYLCSEISTSYQHAKDNCESLLFEITTKEIPSICNTQTIHAQAEIWQNLNHNKWLFITSNDIRCTVLCRDQEDSSITINRIGILELKDNCKAFTNTIILEAQTILKNSSFKDYVPEINLDEDDCCKKNKHNKSVLASMQLNPIKISHMDLNELKYAQNRLTQFDDQLQQQLNKPFFIQYETSILHYLWIFLYSFLTIGTLYLLYRFRFFQKLWSYVKPKAQKCGNTFINCCFGDGNQMRNQYQPSAPLNEITKRHVVVYDPKHEMVSTQITPPPYQVSVRRSYASSESSTKRHSTSSKFTPNKI